MQLEAGNQTQGFLVSEIPVSVPVVLTQHGPWIGSLSSICETVRNANSQGHPRPTELETLGVDPSHLHFNKLPRGLRGPLKGYTHALYPVYSQ